MNIILNSLSYISSDPRIVYISNVDINTTIETKLNEISNTCEFTFTTCNGDANKESNFFKSLQSKQKTGCISYISIFLKKPLDTQILQNPNSFVNHIRVNAIAYMLNILYDDYIEIFNVCTHIDHRGLNIMKILLSDVITNMPQIYTHLKTQNAFIGDLKYMWLGIEIENPIFDQLLRLYIGVGKFINPKITKNRYRSQNPVYDYDKYILELVHEVGKPVSNQDVVSATDTANNLAKQFLGFDPKHSNNYVFSLSDETYNFLLNIIFDPNINNTVEIGGVFERENEDKKSSILFMNKLKNIPNERQKRLYNDGSINEISILKPSVLKGDEKNYVVNPSQYIFNFHTHSPYIYTIHSVDLAWPSSKDLKTIFETNFIRRSTHKNYLNNDWKNVFHIVAAVEGIYIVNVNKFTKGLIYRLFNELSPNANLNCDNFIRSLEINNFPYPSISNFVVESDRWFEKPYSIAAILSISEYIDTVLTTDPSYYATRSVCTDNERKTKDPRCETKKKNSQHTYLDKIKKFTLVYILDKYINIPQPTLELEKIRLFVKNKYENLINNDGTLHRQLSQHPIYDIQTIEWGKNNSVDRAFIISTAEEIPISTMKKYAENYNPSLGRYVDGVWYNNLSKTNNKLGISEILDFNTLAN